MAVRASLGRGRRPVGLTTFSIAARDPETGAVGVCVSTKFLAVGSLCPFAKAAVGAIATQAFVNPMFGPRGLKLLEEGLDAESVLRRLLAMDEGREHRQLSVVDREGRSVSFTGTETVSWSGHRTGPNFAAAGNMLAGPDVVDAMAERFEATRGLPLGERLLQAVEAGQAAGGDKRGRQSAALLVYTTEEYAHLDFRVDDHPDPVAELRRIFELAKEEYLVFQRFLPSRERPAGITDTAFIEENLRRAGQSR